MLQNTLLLVLVVLVTLYTFALINPGPRDHFQYVLSQTEKFANEALVKLNNANSLVNLPNVNFETTNAELVRFQHCKDAAQLLGTQPSANYTKQCYGICGADGSVLEVTEGVEYYHQGVRLSPGFWCIVNPVSCNLNTSYVVATIGGSTCRSKFPNLFGGPDGGRIVACNDEVNPATGSILWDNASNEAVDAATVKMTHEDERLADGSFRFVCHYAKDRHENAYIPHPLNRFHPVENVCTRSVFRATDQVKLITEATTWRCDCGDATQTHVQNINPANPQSPCSSCYAALAAEGLDRPSRLPHLCFNIGSSYKAVFEQNPCAADQFTRGGSECSTTMMNVAATSKLGQWTLDTELKAIPDETKYLWDPR